jgi:tRNA-2-methylthio-N6-dimethylallyladenosine synthase
VGRAAALLEQARRDGPVVEILEAAAADDAAEFPSALPARREVDHAAWLTIQIGCDNSCAFCIVPAVRGSEMSRPFADLMAEAERVVADGAIEITLLGQNVNSYGRDLTVALRADEAGPEDERLAGRSWAEAERRRARPLFADLLRSVGAIAGIRRVRYTSPHPKDIRDDVLVAMAETPTVCEHLHLPLQSGSDEILAAMHRGYTAERYLERVRRARELVDDLAITTDIIVGFPGETDEDFAATLEVAAAAEYDSAFTFVFSPRPGTEAAGLVERFCDPAVVTARYERLRTVVQRSGMRRHEARIGRLEEVVVEGPSKRDPSVLTGRTRQNKLVHFPSAEPLRVGTVASVEVTDAKTHYLLGQLVEVVAVPRRRVRIPVAAG